VNINDLGSHHNLVMKHTLNYMHHMQYLLLFILVLYHPLT